MALIDKLTAIANAIRGKTGKSGNLTLDQMVTEIAGIQTNPTLQAKTTSPTTAVQTIEPDSGYDGLSKVTVNAMPTATQASPVLSVSSAGLITATVEHKAGYVDAGTKTATYQLSIQAAKTVTPGTSNQTAVSSGKYTTGAVTVKGDANLKAENIAKGVSIFGVTGSLESGAKVATGTFSLGTSQRIYNASVTGLGFKPTKICIFYDALTIIQNPVQITTFKEHIFSVYADGDTCYCTYVNYPSGYGYMTVDSSKITLTRTNDGFSISCNGVYFAGSTLGQYRYVAIG